MPKTKPDNIVIKQGSGGESILLRTNHFKMEVKMAL